MKRLFYLVAFNGALLTTLLVPVELIFGNWIRPMSLRDLGRFSIPTDVNYTFDTSTLYLTNGSGLATYTRDKWGLRGSARTLNEIDVLTVGGSTTDQRYLDDTWTWQAVAEREIHVLGKPLNFSNAGVDGQSTIGHAFSLQYWFPLLQGLRPRIVLFYVGINDVLKGEDRDDYDRSVDASNWRTKSALFQFYKAVRGNLRAREVGVTHGRLRPKSSEFTGEGVLSGPERKTLADAVTMTFLQRIDGLQRQVMAWGALPIFVTQTAYGWNADRQPPRGLRGHVRLHGRIANYADVAFLHQHLNRGLIAHCASHRITCFDLASDVRFTEDDYYDPVHNTPAGAEKVGSYLAERLAGLDPQFLGSRR